MRYVLIAIIALAGIGYVLQDELLAPSSAITDCCAAGFDAAPYETTPQP